MSYIDKEISHDYESQLKFNVFSEHPNRTDLDMLSLKFIEKCKRLTKF